LTNNKDFVILYIEVGSATYFIGIKPCLSADPLGHGFNFMKIKRICRNCKKEFKTYPSRIKRNFCSRKCYFQFRKNKTIIQTKKCLICGEKFFIYLSKYQKGMFCSRKCKGMAQRGKNHFAWKGGIKKHICIICGKIFYKNNDKFCSVKCYGKWQSINRIKDKHWNWKGGKDYENKKIRNNLEYGIWRKEIYKKDRWTCRICGSKKQIVAHHLKLFSEYPELRFDINNGITLCRSCHLKLHKENPRTEIIVDEIK